MKPRIAIIRGAFLNRYEMQFYEPLVKQFDLTALGSLRPFHDKFAFPIVKLPCPMDLPNFPYKMPILNRLFIDAHYLFGLEEKLKGFDIVHSAETYYHYTQQALNAKKKGYVKKVVATVLENIPHNNEGIWGRKSFKKRAREELDWIIALTNKTKKVLLEEGADPNKISFISHFIDTKRFKPDQKRQKEIRNPKLRKFNILYCGRLEEYKGVFEILSAFHKLQSDRGMGEYDLKLVLAGNGSEKQDLIQREDELGIINRVSHIETNYDNMPEIYKKAHIYVAPSKPTKTWEEQYNTTLLEAQASGLPIITTKSGGIPENVGDAAILVKPGDDSGIYTSLKKIILEPKLRINYAKKARDRAEKVHDIKHGAKKLTDLYRFLLAN